MKRPIALIVLTIAVLLGSLRACTLPKASDRPATARIADEALGLAAANLLNELDVAVLLVPSPLEGTALARKNAIQRYRGEKVLRIEELPSSDYTDLWGLKPAVYERLMREHGDADVILSMVALPPYGLITGNSPPIERPRFYALLLGGDGFGLHLARGHVQQAIMPAIQVPKELSPKSTSPQLWFDTYYRIVGTEQADQYPQDLSPEQPWSDNASPTSQLRPDWDMP